MEQETKSAGVWVKASERLPENGIYHIKIQGVFNRTDTFKDGVFYTYQDEVNNYSLEEIEWLDESTQPDGWINVEDRLPNEEDGQLLVTNGNGFYEIIWYSKEEDKYKKSFAFDDDDRPVFWKGNFTHWRPLPTPPNQAKDKQVQ